MFDIKIIRFILMSHSYSSSHKCRKKILKKILQTVYSIELFNVTFIYGDLIDVNYKSN